MDPHPTPLHGQFSISKNPTAKKRLVSTRHCAVWFSQVRSEATACHHLTACAETRGHVEVVVVCCLCCTFRFRNVQYTSKGTHHPSDQAFLGHSASPGLLDSLSLVQLRVSVNAGNTNPPKKMMVSKRFHWFPNVSIPFLIEK